MLMRRKNRRRLILYGLLGCAFTFTLASFLPPVQWLMRGVYNRTLGRLFYPTPDVSDAKSRLREILGDGISFPLPEARIVIHKKQRRAELFSGNSLVQEYPIVLGGAPEGDKQQEGDRKTPEGEYYLCTRLNRSSYHLFLGINYPNAADVKSTEQTLGISPETIKRIIDAEQQQEKPPWDSPLGGEIGLHGGGTLYDWTYGCIAFENEAIEEIWTATTHWTPVTIKP